MPRKSSNDARNQAQRERQQKLRDASLKAKRPDRDDIARVALYWMITNMAEKATKEVREEFQDRIVSMLAEQGFDERACEIVFDDLVHKYRTGGSPFRRKVHLLHPDAGDLDD
jgi:hypothetical protein